MWKNSIYISSLSIETIKQNAVFQTKTERLLPDSLTDTLQNIRSNTDQSTSMFGAAKRITVKRTELDGDGHIHALDRFIPQRKKLGVHCIEDAVECRGNLLLLPGIENGPFISYLETKYIARLTVAQAVSRRLPAAAVLVRAQVKSCGLCGAQRGTVADFLRKRQFLLPLIQSTNCSTIITIYHPGLVH
jgi:hypothetical protein